MYHWNGWKMLFKSKKSVLLLFLLAIISGTLYAVYLKERQEVNLKYMNQYLVDSELDVELNINYMIQIYWGYFKKYLVVWLLGMIKVLMPLAVGVAFFDFFAYGFSIAMLYLWYGIDGMILGGQLFVIQGVIMCLLLIELTDELFKRKQLFNGEMIKCYSRYLLFGGFGCFIITGIELLINNWTQY